MNEGRLKTTIKGQSDSVPPNRPPPAPTVNSTNIEPHPDYDMLVRQFKPLQQLLKSKEQQVSFLRQGNEKLTRELLSLSNEVLDSEREMNRQLTERVLFLEQALENVTNNMKHMFSK